MIRSPFCASPPTSVQWDLKSLTPLLMSSSIAHAAANCSCFAVRASKAGPPPNRFIMYLSDSPIFVAAFFLGEGSLWKMRCHLLQLDIRNGCSCMWLIFQEIPFEITYSPRSHNTCSQAHDLRWIWFETMILHNATIISSIIHKKILDAKCLLSSEEACKGGFLWE